MEAEYAKEREAVKAAVKERGVEVGLVLYSLTT